MEPALSALGLKVAAPAVLAGYRALRHELARQGDEQEFAHSLAGLDDVLDEAISVLARQWDGLWEAVNVAAKGVLSRPALFDEPVPRAWIVTEEAQTSIKLAARAAIRGEDDAPHAARAIAHYQLFLDDVGPDDPSPDAAQAYGAALAFLLASLRRALTPGDRAVLEAVHGVRKKLDNLVPEDAGDIIDAHVEAEVTRLRARRFFRSADTGADAAGLVSALIDGRLKRATPPKRAWALAWCARVLSFIDRDVAQVALAQASALGGGALPEFGIAQAFLAAVDDHGAGLALIDVGQGPAAATAAFQIMRRGLGAEAGLERARAAGLDLAKLDSDGRYALITARLEVGDWEGALAVVGALDPADFENTPALLWVAGSVLVGAQLPDDLRRGILQDIPAHPGAFPLREDQAARDQRQLARTFMKRAAEACRRLGLAREAGAAERYGLWLALRDPVTREAAREDLRGRIDRPGSELAYLPLALAFELGVEHARAEAAIERELARGKGEDPDVGAAAVALLLDLAERDAGGAAAYIERRRALLGAILDSDSFVGLEVGILVQAGRPDAARALLARAGKALPEALQTMLASAVEAGDEPSVEALEGAYRANPQTATLAHLVRRYRELDYSPRFLELARQLLAELPTHQAASECLAFLSDQGRDAEALELIGVLGDMVPGSKLLSLQAAWIHFRLGRFDEADALLQVAEEAPALGQARMLRYQLLVASGRWEEIDGFLERQWQARDELAPLELAQCANLAAQTRAKRVSDLLLEAVRRDPEDPQVLVAAYSAAVTAGLEEDIPDAASWIMRAAERSGEDGPVQTRSIAELLDERPEWDARVDEAVRGWAEAELPLTGVAMMLRRPWLELQVAPLLQNPEQPIANRRRAAPLFSGRQRTAEGEASGGLEIALDRHALVTLALVGALEPVVAACDRIHVAHDLFTDLFAQRQRLAFHQPSKIAFAYRMLDLLARGRVRAFAPSTLADVALVTEIGASRAALLSEATAHDEGGHYLVHPFPITRVGSLLSEPVALESFAGQLVSCSGVLDAVERAGRLTEDELARARRYFDEHDRRWPDEPVIADGATFYLSDLAVDYFRYTGLIDRIAEAGFTVVVAGSELEEAEALRDVESLSGAVDRTIDAIRAVLVPTLAAGKLRVDAAPPGDDGPDNFAAATASLVAQAETLVSDDRFFNRYAHFDLPEGRRRIVSSLDLIVELVQAGRIEPALLDGARTRLRRGGAFLVGTDGDELVRRLGPAGPDVRFRETGELRAIRESLRLAQMRGWFNQAVDLGWLVALQDGFCDAIVRQWCDGIPDELARARSDWLFACMQSRDWAQTSVGLPPEGLARNGMVLDLLKLIALYRRIDPAARVRFSAWVETEVMELLWTEEPQLRERLYRDLRALLLAVTGDAVHAQAIDERQALAVAIDGLPEFLQVELLKDADLRARTGHELEATVSVGEATFPRSVFWRAISEIYAAPSSERRVVDGQRRRWTLRTDPSDHAWILVLERQGTGYRTQGIPGLHPDADERLAMLDAALTGSGMTLPALADWRDRLRTSPLDADEIEELDRALRALPGAVAAAIEESFGANRTSIEVLVPPSRDYWTAFIGDAPAESLEAFATQVAPGQIACMRDHYHDADRWLLLLAASPAVLNDGRWGPRTAEQWLDLGRWAIEAGDPIAKAAFVELALPHLTIVDGLAEQSGALVDQIEAFDPLDETGPLHLLSSLVMLVDGELSRVGILADVPPFQRRLAAIAQAALIARVIQGRMDTARFARFCTEQRGWQFFVQNLADLQQEPRWRPDFISATQLRHELIGRVVNAAAALPEDGLPDALRARILDDEGSLRSRMAIPMVFWPGPLEGGNQLQPLPEEFCEQLDRAFAEGTLAAEALTLLTNLATMFAIPPDIANRAVDRIRSAGPRLLAEIPAERIDDQLLGLAFFAASHRLVPLADAVQILVRVRRLQGPMSVAEEMQLALHAAASRKDAADWRRFLGGWIAELAGRLEDLGEAESLLGWSETLCQIQPLFRNASASAIASLRLLLDR